MNNTYKHLDSLVNELYQVDSFWAKCQTCPFSGQCCNGANIKIFPFELPTIIDHLNRCSQKDKQSLKKRLIDKEYCPFQFDNKCLIHDCRPLNCRWTPYKAQWNSERIVNYYLSNSNCSLFSYRELELPFYDNIDQPFVKLENRYYLNLDHYLKQNQLFIKDLFYLSDLLLNNLSLLDC